ncbi:TcaA NTF2-like domain-containing protein [Paenibacillus oleatilyticus]|uniref:TcaA NTF2-like domain-containing protein n=1 Tax=Paenibacillus oleatilyticus TaxID=2594886 RepID=UPI001C1F90BC|nr:hypothetical protein [Paenibacillus oleatilyticus]MBU7314286.1 hypothetical protein [Paenibacillus oleatilyticus]
MKQQIFRVYYLIFILCISVCGYSFAEESETFDPLKQNAYSISSTNTFQPDLERSFYGSWVISKQIASCQISAAGKGEIRKELGEKITFSPDKVRINNSTLSHPKYTMNVISDVEFFNRCYTNAEKVGIRGKMITEVEVMDQEAKLLQADLFIKDQDTLIYLTNKGIYYELQRLPKVGTLENLREKGMQVIDNQSFQVELNHWGKVKFISGKQLEGSELKASFYLVDENEIILYEFPEFYGNDRTSFEGIRAVSFKDVDQDGLKDIIIIAEFSTGIGESGNIPFPVAGIYFQRDNEFESIPQLDEKINLVQQNENVAAILEFAQGISLDDIKKLSTTKADDYEIGLLITNYEQRLVEAINTHDFSTVEYLLIPYSPLYEAQKKLVEHLVTKYTTGVQ